MLRDVMYDSILTQCGLSLISSWKKHKHAGSGNICVLSFWIHFYKGNRDNYDATQTLLFPICVMKWYFLNCNLQYLPAGATIKRRIDPIHDTNDVDESKYSINSTAKTPNVDTTLKQEVLYD